MANTHLDKFLEDFHAKMPAAPASAKGEKAEGQKATWLLVACIDGRYPHVVHRWMSTHYPNELYDQINLAGTSLGVNAGETEKPAWRQTMLDHIEISIRLHPIGGVLILDHRTCAAFREFKLLTKAEENTPKEIDVHKRVSTDIFESVLPLFTQYGRVGYVAVYLAPEVSNPGADDFPSAPLLLHEGYSAEVCPPSESK